MVSRRVVFTVALVWGAAGCVGGTGQPATTHAAVAPVSSGVAPTTSSGSTKPVTPPAQPPAPTPPVPTPTSSGGSGGIAGVTPGSPALGLELVAGNAASQYDLYVPQGYNGSPMGIVLAFHGVEGTPTPDSWFEVCVYYCNNDRFIIVAPRGDVNDGGSGAWTQPFGRDVLDYVRSKYNVDDKRQYVAAISGGALPGIWMAFASGPATYTTQYGNYTVKTGYQADFAAVGFCSAEYQPSDPDFATMQSETASQLGFTPALWTDYGSLSPDQPFSDNIAAWATGHGYAPVKEVVRPGEGHPPNPPFSFETQMFDLFAATAKP